MSEATPATPDFVAGSSASTQTLRDEPLKDPLRFREAVPRLGVMRVVGLLVGPVLAHHALR